MSNNLTNKEKVISLYNFIKELNLSKQKVVLNIKDYPWSLALDDIPQDEDNIKVYYRDRELEDTLDDNKQLLTVHKPEFEKCPDPDIIFINWLESGWEKYDNEIIIKSTIDKFDNSNNFDIDDKRDITLEDTGVIDNFYNKDESKNKNESNSDNNIVSEKNIDNNSVECFEDNPKRVKAFEKWNEKRKKWAIQQKRIANTRDFFNNLYQLKIDLERDKDTLELVVGNGFILDSENQEINHPVITRRVKINYNIADNNISIEDTDSASELYISMLSEIDYIRKESLNIFIDEVVKNDYHPLDRIDTIDFLKRFIRQLAPDSIFITDTNSKNFEFAPIAMQVKPCFICRKRMDKTVRIIEQIIENIEKTDFIPNPIIDIVSGGKIDVDSIEKDESIEEQLASVGGESVDILLSKEANKEQLEIAKRLEKFNAVIVQGPPGTGKTHIIANLVGNILAKGNSVLITSHTQKALNVLKDKLESGIRDLGVSVLDDSNEDMVKSIDGITTYMADNTSFDLQKQISKISLERKNIIEELADVRKKIFAIINKERESIFYNGESYSPSQVAYFIAENEESLGNIIPGRIFSNNLPLNLDELTELYQTNESINSNDEFELSCDLPNPSELIPPEIFEKLTSSIEEANTNIDIIKQKSQINIISSLEENQITFEIGKNLLL